MIEIFSHKLPTGLVLLEYAEKQPIESFDLSITLSPAVIEQVIKPRYPELVAKLTDLHKKDFRAGVMIDRYIHDVTPPSIVSFVDPEVLFAEWGVEAVIDEIKQFYASAIYLGRDKLVRTVYRNPEEPKTKTDVHKADGKFSHHENVYTGSLPEHMNWVWGKQRELKGEGIKATLTHFKDLGENSKAYFKVVASY